MGLCGSKTIAHQEQIPARDYGAYNVYLQYLKSSFDKNVYHQIVNTNWLDTINCRSSAVTLRNTLQSHNVGLDYKINGHPLSSYILLEYSNQCLKENQIFRSQLSVIIRELDMKFAINTLLCDKSKLYLDYDKKELKFLPMPNSIIVDLEPMLFLNIIGLISRYSTFKLLNQVKSAIEAKVFNQSNRKIDTMPTSGKHLKRKTRPSYPVSDAKYPKSLPPYQPPKYDTNPSVPPPSAPPIPPYPGMGSTYI